jgi:uncharacterized protein YjbI with pentapeptide repeats
MADARWGRRAAGVVGGLLLALCVSPAPAVAAPRSAAPAPCTPGSGRKLAGKHVTPPRLARGSLQCADLTGANLSGLDLVQADLTSVLAPNANFSGAGLGQADLTGAVLRGANLQNADLTQATLTGADLSGADLTNAHLIQLEAAGVNLSNAELSGADFTQATLNQANLSGADVDRADFTQAELGGANVSNLRGLTNWSTYLLIGAGVIFVLLAAGALRRALRRGPKRAREPDVGGPAPIPAPPMPVPASPMTPTPPAAVGSVWEQAHAQSTSFWQQRSETGPGIAPTPGMPVFAAQLAGLGAFNPINGPATRGIARGLVLGLLAAVLVAFGAHMFVGGILGQATQPFDSLSTTACSGPQCAVGIGSGMLGIFIGIFVVIAGFGVRSAA